MVGGERLRTLAAPAAGAVLDTSVGGAALEPGLGRKYQPAVGVGVPNAMNAMGVPQLLRVHSTCGACPEPLGLSPAFAALAHPLSDSIRKRRACNPNGVVLL
jgi:hypothetical protein